MTVRVNRTWMLDSSPAAVRLRAVDVEGRTAGARRGGARDVAVTVSELGGDVVARIDRQVATGAPAGVVSVVGAWLTLSQVETWAAADSAGEVWARIRVEAVRPQLVVQARLVFTASTGGCVARVDGSARARLGVLSEAFERYAAGRMLTELGRQLTGDTPSAPQRR